MDTSSEKFHSSMRSMTLWLSDSVHVFLGGMELWAKAPCTIKIFWNGGDAVAAGRGLNTPAQNGGAKRTAIQMQGGSR